MQLVEMHLNGRCTLSCNNLSAFLCVCVHLCAIVGVSGVFGYFLLFLVVFGCFWVYLGVLVVFWGVFWCQ